MKHGFALIAVAGAVILLPGFLAATSLAHAVASQHIPPAYGVEPQLSISETDARAELQTGTQLTTHGDLQQAIPHLLVAQHAGIEPYATGVNLGICYLGTENYRQAIVVLQALGDAGLGSGTVDNLLAQAYIGDAQPQDALRTVRRAAGRGPQDEKFYAYLADACSDHKDYSLGLQIVDQGLKENPASARLHYERGLFLSELGFFEENGDREFDRAAQLAPDSYIGFLALVQKDLYEDDFSGADKVLRQAIQSGHRDYRMLSLLGTVLLHEGAAPGDARFAEAKNALETSAQENPSYSATQIALGKIYLLENEPQKAIDHLQIGRRLEPDNPAVYANLASAYDRLGDHAQARLMRLQIGRLLAEKKSSGSAGQRP
ncbi:MAG: tetratricopeptide repeat protein [Acidobacteriaceae bacterium]